MGFNALIHAHCPDLIDYDALIPSRHIDNLNNAFDVAERDLGIPRLLDAEGELPKANSANSAHMVKIKLA